MMIPSGMDEPIWPAPNMHANAFIWPGGTRTCTDLQSMVLALWGIWVSRPINPPDRKVLTAGLRLEIY